MRVFIKDANLLIDLHLGGILDAWLNLGYDTATTSLVLIEIKDSDQKAVINKEIDEGRLAVEDIEGEDWDLAAERAKKWGISVPDASVSIVAQKREFAVLLTGDGRLRKKSLEEGIDVKSGSVLSLDFNVDGTVLASGSADHSIRLWDVERSKLKRTLSGHAGAVARVAFSPNGETLASGSDDHSIRLWDVKTGEIKAILTGHSQMVTSVAFSPDGETLASASDDDSIRLWKLKSGEQITVLRGGPNRMVSLAFNPTVSTLAAGSGQMVKIWDINKPRLNLYTYLEAEEGWCQFDPDTQELVWNDPKDP